MVIDCGVRAAWILAFGQLFANAAFAGTADKIWVGGPILTMDDDAMRAEAVAVKDGKILAVGKKADVMPMKGDTTEVIDLGGRTMIPGFVDAHGHVVFGGFQALSANMQAPPDGNVKDIASLQQILREWVAANGEAIRKVNLIAGFGYDNAQLAELRHPTREDLDAVSTDVPILLVHQSGHIGAVNSKALEMLGISAETKNPSGGVIQRQPGSNMPNGVLEEAAFFSNAPKLLTQLGPSGLKTFVKAGAELWARFGYTTAQEGRSEPSVVAAIKAVGAEGGLKVDVATYSDVLVAPDFIKQNVSPTYTNRVRLAGAKLTIDGSPQGFTAWRDKPYFDPVGTYPPGYVGYQTVTNDTVIDAIDWAFANDVQIMTHANGEAALDLLIAALRAADAKHGNFDRRPVLIHGQFLREDQVDAYRQLKVMPSLFPMHTFYWGDWHRDHTVGPLAADNISPTGWVVARGMRFTSHHDAPVAFPDSMRVLDATVTRRSRSGDILGPAHRVDVITALKAMTIWSAYQHREEELKGSLKVGKLADFVILSKDPTAVDPETIDQIKVTETVKEGTTIYALTPEEQRRGDLMLRPDHAGNYAFERFLTNAAAYQDVQSAPGFMRKPALYQMTSDGPHAKACVTRYLDTLVATMAARSDVPVPK